MSVGVKLKIIEPKYLTSMVKKLTKIVMDEHGNDKVVELKTNKEKQIAELYEQGLVTENDEYVKNSDGVCVPHIDGIPLDLYVMNDVTFPPDAWEKKL